VRPVQTFIHWIAAPASVARWMLVPGAGPLAARSSPVAPLELVVGPEGGFSEREHGLALDRGCEPVSLGPRVLRTETAPIAALAAINALWGDFRS
jgi:16S rRNA (uracil1498-N3)-methyltransferase